LGDERYLKSFWGGAKEQTKQMLFESVVAQFIGQAERRWDMKTILSVSRYHYLKRVGIFLIVIALVAGIAGCTDGGVGPYDLTWQQTQR